MPKKFLIVDGAGHTVAHADINPSVVADAVAFASKAPTFVAQVVSEHAVPDFGNPDEGTATQQATARKRIADAEGIALRAGIDYTEGAEVTAEDEDTARETREKELKALPADDVREIARSLGVEHATKAENVAAILDIEFP